MRYDLIKDFEQRARAARDTAEHEKVFVEAKVLLSLAEYMALLARLWQPLETGELETSKPEPRRATQQTTPAGRRYRFSV